MTYTALISRLTACGSAAPEYEACELVRVFDSKDRTWCLLNKDVNLSAKIDAALEKREAGIPLQYIVGEAWFFGNRFIVSPSCLIPQPDTEHLVALSLKHMNNNSRILDLCTGSGCIAVSLLKERADSTAVAVDISEDALKIAEKNLKLHGCDRRAKLINANILDDSVYSLVGNADIIVSNPPYISTDVIPTLSNEVRHEPAIALDGGADGMDFYRRIISDLTKYMNDDAVMLLEIGYDQGDRVIELCKLSQLSCQLHKDFGGNFRVAEIRRRNII